MKIQKINCALSLFITLFLYVVTAQATVGYCTFTNRGETSTFIPGNPPRLIDNEELYNSAFGVGGVFKFFWDTENTSASILAQDQWRASDVGRASTGVISSLNVTDTAPRPIKFALSNKCNSGGNGWELKSETYSFTERHTVVYKGACNLYDNVPPIGPNNNPYPAKPSMCSIL